jgi:hypothetical protein
MAPDTYNQPLTLVEHLISGNDTFMTDGIAGSQLMKNLWSLRYLSSGTG